MAKAKKKTKKDTPQKKATPKKPIKQKAVKSPPAKGTPEETTASKELINHYVIKKTKNRRAKWYVIHTYSGHEQRVAINMIQRIKTMSLEDKILEILIPTQNKIQIKRGKKKALKEKLFPGYMLIKIILDDDSWLAVRTTPGVTSFVGIGTKPTPLPPDEVQSIQRFMQQEAPKYKASFTVGEAVRIIEGPFADFLGSVDSIDEAKGKVHVLVSIFGRETPVELDFLQIQKI